MALYDTPSLAGNSRANFEQRLKTQFFEKWDDHVHKKHPIVKMLASKKGTMGGKESLGSVMDTLPQSAGIALFEGADLPSPTASDYFQPILHARDLYIRLRWTGQVERAARGGNKFAWAAPRAEDVKAATDQFLLNYARMLYLGPYQPLATVASYNDGTDVVTVDDRDSRNSSALWAFGTHYLRKNMEVDYVTSLTGDPVLADGSTGDSGAATITAKTATTVTLSRSGESATDPADGDLIVPWGSRRVDLNGLGGAATDVTYYAGINGLMQIAGDRDIYAKLYDLARSTYTTLEGVHNTNGGSTRVFEEDLISIVVDQIVDNGTGDEPDCLVMHRSVRREYVRQLTADRRFMPVVAGSGFEGDNKLTFTAGDAELPIQTDRDCPPGLAFVLNKKDFGWYEQSALGEIGGERFVANKDAHEQIWHKSGNIVCEKPFNNGIIDDIAYDVDALTS